MMKRGAGTATMTTIANAPVAVAIKPRDSGRPDQATTTRPVTFLLLPRKMFFPLSVLVFVGFALAKPADQKEEKYHPGPKVIDEATRWSQCRQSNQSIYDFQVQTLDGKYTDLSQYRGQVLLVINVATYCAYTQQYIDFNPLIEANKKAGFTILGFPCNQFYLQEPAENHEIMNGITYVRPGNGWKPHENLHIYGKLEVNGANHHPLYEFLKDQCPQTVNTIGKRDELIYNPIRPNDITWNFEKFLIDRQGKPRFRFHPTAWSHGDTVQPYLTRLSNERFKA